MVFHGSNIDSIKFDRMGAEVVYRFLLDLGATKDIKFDWDEQSGKIHIVKSFHYTSGMIPIKDDDGARIGQQYYGLSSYIKFLVRFDKSAHKRMRNVENNINAMHQVIDKFNKQLRQKKDK